MQNFMLILYMHFQISFCASLKRADIAKIFCNLLRHSIIHIIKLTSEEFVMCFDYHQTTKNERVIFTPSYVVLVPTITTISIITIIYYHFCSGVPHRTLTGSYIEKDDFNLCLLALFRWLLPSQLFIIPKFSADNTTTS